MSISLLPDNPASWTYRSWEELMSIPREQREKLQLEATQIMFRRLRDRIPALKKLADRQGVDTIDKIEDILPVCFDHRVLKNYPIQIIENRDFAKLTTWLDKLTAHDLTKVDLTGLKTIEEWLGRLEAYGMLVTYSSGTTGKLSFVPRSKDEFGPWKFHFFNVNYAASGVNSWTTKLPTFFPGYRGGYQTMLKMMSLFNVEMAGGEEHYHTLYNTHIPADLMALSGRLQAAEDKGELATLGLDPALIEQRQQMLAQGRSKDGDLDAWFTDLIEKYKGQRVKIGGTFADMFRVAKAGLERGVRCEFAPGSIISGGGGMKGYKDAPDDWEDQIKTFFGVDFMGNQYGFSECIGNAPLGKDDFFYLPPYSVPLLMGPDGEALPREGVQTGRLVLVDLVPQSYWGGFTSGDEVTIHWDDEDTETGWRAPRIAKSIRRIGENEGGEDKITCAGSQQAYNEFMEFVAGEA
ncbi:hypothetical protein GCM10011494_00160 [Novosphingobium endophyticum]|uniref:Uncharacterized protein n=1 Tax=Novosphingobium endophyticum TaxID=1955250 RepID=A0A916TNB1_9SPHN|nr:hypothetical protein [Novosphingobium endophyticum]GGB85860.1 hypothetical protein GCM10011494_00160 [Novosphingobium endophyticum]